MYCTTDPRMIEKVVTEARQTVRMASTLRSTVAAAPNWKRQAVEDRVSAAEATIALYADLLDENDKCAEYRPVQS